ncbi:MAG: YdiY family protein [Bacillota bacterium]|jgi:putative salt-induced outer membrane protein
MIRHALAAILLSSAAGGVASAQDTSHVALVGDVGFVNAAGNTSLTTLNTGEKLTWTRGAVKLGQQGAFIYGRTEGVTSASQLIAGLRADYALSSRLGVYGMGNFERNRFAGFARRFSEGAGLTLAALQTAADSLSFEGGLDLTQQRSITEVSDNFTSARAAANYRHHLNAKAFVSQFVEVLPDLETSKDLRVNSETAIVAPLSARFAVKLGYLIRFDNLPEPGFRKTDRLFTSGLQVTL